MKRIIPYILLLALCSVHAQKSDTAARKSPQPRADTSPAVTSGTLEAFSRDLDSAYHALMSTGVVGAVPLYSRARARIKQAREIVQNKPESQDAAMAVQICSVFTSAALVHMEKEQNLIRIQSLDKQKDSLMLELHNLHETINGLERSYASRLKDDMEEERLRAISQTSKLKEDLEAERERARKIMEDAQRRFGELQSELIKVSKDARGTIISMSDILFDVGKAGLTSDLKTSLAKIAGILIVHKDPKIVVEGHTDNMGTEEFNQKLSEERAGNVMDFLIEQGVDESRLSSVGYAFHKPIADNATREGRAKNRRVDLIIKD